MVSQIFRPSRFSSLIVADAKNLSRDPILLLVMVMSALMPLLFTTFKTDLNQFGLQFFDLPNLSTYVAPIAFLMPAYLIGWVFGFLLLEDRDDHTLLAVETTAVGKQGFLIYRLTIASIISAVLAAAAATYILPPMPLYLSLALILMVALQTATTSLILLALAGNKVEGLALSKLLNVGGLLPLLAIIPNPLRYIAGLYPSYWVGELIGLSAQAYLPHYAALLLAIIIHLAWIAFMFTKTINKAEQL